MKGVIIACFRQLIMESAGQESWDAIMQKAGLDKGTVFFPMQDVEDERALRIVRASCEVLGRSIEETAEEFGHHWMTKFAPKIYKAHFRKAQNARDFLLSIDSIHDDATKNINNARPPRFEYHWPDRKTLIVTYHSHRGLVEFLVGLARGVATHFGENLEVAKIDEERVRVTFNYDAAPVD